jgi:CheY-like chemotaxis protein
MIHAQWRKVALVVDDEAFARLYAVQMLLDQGFFVLEAADAAEGLDLLLSQQDISLLFTDISMPGDLDGLDLVERAHAERPDIAILVASGLGPPPDGCLPEGSSFLAKPYTAHALNEAIGAGMGLEAEAEPLVRRA